MKKSIFSSVLRSALVMITAAAIPFSVSASTVCQATPSAEPKSSSDTFVFANDATSMTLKLDGNKQYISSLSENNYSGTKYITSNVEVPFVNTINSTAVEWEYAGNTKDDTDGLTVTFNYYSTDRKYTLHSVWEIKPGSGPVEYSSTIENHCGADAHFDSAMAVTTDLSFNVDGETNVWVYDRMKHGNAGENWNTPIRQFKIESGFNRSFEVSNDFASNSGDLPFMMFDIDGNHGLYYGFMYSFGNMSIDSADGKAVHLTAGNPVTNDTAYVGDGETFTVPGMFVGVYEGDTDDGSNNMKNWFWNYKVTDSLRDNANEPQIEIDWGSDRPWIESITNPKSWGPYVEEYGLDGVGYEVVKYDYEWTVKPGMGCQVDTTAEQSWTANRERFPDGMNLYSLLKGYSSKMNFSLYMCNSYQGADLVIKSQQQKQIDALKERFNPNASGEYGYDYWRSDFWVEHPRNFGYHAGLLNVLDEMISWSKTQDHTFHYEHCAGGGTLKDFTTLERMTFMTTEDSSCPINYRMALYNCSYMINPAQLKSDVSMGDGPSNEENYKYIARTSIMGASMIAGNTQSWEREGVVDTVRDAWQLYKDKQRPIIRGGNVYHILDMPTSSRVNTGAGINSYKDWDGLEFYNNNIDKGSVFLFCENNYNAIEQKYIVLKGLDPVKKYNITFEDRTALNCTMTGEELMTKGILVTGFTGNYDSEIMWIEADKTQSLSKARFISAIKKASAVDTSAASDLAQWNYNQAVINAMNVLADDASGVYDYWYANEKVNAAAADLETVTDPVYDTQDKLVNTLSDRITEIGEVNADNDDVKIKLIESAEKMLAKITEQYGSEVIVPELDTLNAARAAYNELHKTALGDVNGDTFIDSADALKILQFTVGKTELTEEQKTVADVNKSGSVDSSDALLVLQYSVGKITEF